MLKRDDIPHFTCFTSTKVQILTRETTCLKVLEGDEMAVPPPVRGGSRWTPARIKLDAQGHLAAKSAGEEGAGGGGGGGAAAGGLMLLIVSVYSIYIHT